MHAISELEEKIDKILEKASEAFKRILEGEGIMNSPIFFMSSSSSQSNLGSYFEERLSNFYSSSAIAWNKAILALESEAMDEAQQL
jgi:hypothetical protein